LINELFIYYLTLIKIYIYMVEKQETYECHKDVLKFYSKYKKDVKKVKTEINNVDFIVDDEYKIIESSIIYLL